MESHILHLISWLALLRFSYLIVLFGFRDLGNLRNMSIILLLKCVVAIFDVKHDSVVKIGVLI